MLKIFAIFIFAFSCHALPRYQRLRRQAEDATTTECKNTYDQCPEWKGQGMCASEQYKDYMATVCPVTCEFCKEKSRESSAAEASSPVTQQSAEPVKAEESMSNPYEPASNTAGQRDSAQPSTDKTEAEKEHQEYQQMLHTYYDSVKEQQDAYQRSIAVQYPEYANSAEPSSANSDAVVAAAPPTENFPPPPPPTVPVPAFAPDPTPAAPEPVAATPETVPTRPEPVAATVAPTPEAAAALPVAAAPAQEPAVPSNVQAEQPSYVAPASPTTSYNAPLPPPDPMNANVQPSLPANIPNDIAKATGAIKPTIVMSPEVGPYNPANTSSALYSKEKTNKNKKTESEEDQTDETVKTESKHLEKNINKVKEHIKVVTKKLSQSQKETDKKKGNELQQKEHNAPTDDEGEDDNDEEEEEEKDVQKEKVKQNYNKTNSTTAEQDSEEDDTEEDLQEYDSKRTKMTAPKIINVSNSQKVTATTARKSKTEYSGSGSSADLMSEAKESGSGSGDEGALENDLKELSLLTSLNFEDGGGATDLDTEYDSILSPSVESHVRDEIDTPDDESMYEMRETADKEEQGDENEQENNEEEENGSGSGSNEESESGSGSGKPDESEDETNKKEDKENEEERESEASDIKGEGSENNGENVDPKETDPTQQQSEEEQGSGQAENKEDEENTDEEEAKAIQPSKQVKQQKAAKGTVTILLRQNFKAEFQNPESASYKMLSGNVERDFKKALKAKLTDISFSEGSIEGNPRQTGKTKITFNFDGGNEQKLMKKLTKMVDGQQSVNGLSVYSGSLEFDE